MPRIEKLRITNIKLDNEQKLMSNQTWDFKANNTLFLLQNGGGKSSVINLTMQAIKPNGFGRSNYKSKQLKNYAKDRQTINVALEWRLDDEALANIIIGVCYKKQGYSASNDENEQQKFNEEFFTYIVDTNSKGIESIDELPFIDETRVVDYREILAKMKDAPNVSIFNNRSRKEYEDTLAHYNIFVNEWEMMAKVNVEEDGVAKYFDAMITSQQVLDRFFVPAIVKNIYSSEEAANSPLELFKKYKDVIIDIPRIQKMMAALNAIINQANVTLDNIGKHQKIYNELEEKKVALYQAFETLKISNEFATNQMKFAEENLLAIEEAAKELHWKIKSYERHRLNEELVLTQIEQAEKENEVTELEETVKTLNLKISELIGVQKFNQLNQAQQDAEKEKVALEIAKMGFAEKNKKYAEATNKLNQQYSKLYAENKGKIEGLKRSSHQLNIALQQSQNQHQTLQNEENEIIRKQVKIEIKLVMYREELRAVMNQLQNYDGIGLDLKIETLKVKVREIEEKQNELAKVQQELNQQKIMVSLDSMENKNQIKKTTEELRMLEIEYDQFLVDEDKINTALRRVLTSDYDSYVSEYGIDVLALPQYMYMLLDAKVQSVSSGIEKRKQLNKELSTRLKMIESKGYTVSKEAENVADYLTSRSIAVTIGADWLLKNEMDVENKKEIVKKHPLLSVSLVIEKGQMNTIERLMSSYKSAHLTSPIFFIEKTSLEGGAYKNNPYEVEAGTFIYHNYENKYTIQEWEIIKADIALEKAQLDTEMQALDTKLKELEETKYLYKKFEEQYTNTTRTVLNEKRSITKSNLVSLKDAEVTLDEKVKTLEDEEKRVQIELNEMGQKLAVVSKDLHFAENFKNRYKDIRNDMLQLDRIGDDLKRVKKKIQATSLEIEENVQKEKRLNETVFEYEGKLNRLKADKDYLKIANVQYAEDLNTGDYNVTKETVIELNKNHSLEKEQLDKIALLLNKYEEECVRLESEIKRLGFDFTYFVENQVHYNELTLQTLETKSKGSEELLKAKQKELQKLQLTCAKTAAKIEQEDKSFKNEYQPTAFQYGEMPIEEKGQYEQQLNANKSKQDEVKAELKKLTIVLKELETSIDKLSEISRFFKVQNQPGIIDKILEVSDIKQLVNVVREGYDTCAVKKKESRNLVDKNIQTVVNIARDKGDRGILSMVEGIQNEANNDEGNLTNVYHKFVQLIEAENRHREAEKEKELVLKEAQGRLIESFFSYGSNLYNFIKELPRHSNVTINSETFKLFDISWTKNETAQAQEEIRYYLNDVLIPQVKKKKEQEVTDSEIDDYLKKELTPYKILSLVANPDKFTIKVLKPREKNLNMNKDYQTWEERSRIWSGGELHASSIALFIAVNTFIRHKQTNMIAPPSILITDNPFAKASSDHVVAPMIEICRATNTQLISFTDHRKKEIEVEYDTVLNNKYIEVGGRKHLYTSITSKNTKEVNLLSSGKQVKFDI